jgi:hypothetical protein
MSEKFTLSNSKRYAMYKEMLKYDPRIWRQEHHIVKVLINVLIGNYTMFMIYKLYYNHYDSTRPLLHSLLKPKFIFLTMTTIAIDAALFHFNYIHLPKLVYEEFYSKEIVPDIDYLDLYDHIVTKTKLNK